MVNAHLDSQIYKVKGRESVTGTYRVPPKGQRADSSIRSGDEVNVHLSGPGGGDLSVDSKWDSNITFGHDFQGTCCVSGKTEVTLNGMSHGPGSHTWRFGDE